jgi:hypothetical protein
MRLFSHPIAFPLTLIAAGGFLLMNQFTPIHAAEIRNLWPVAIIAAGLEELYLWAGSGERQ